MKLPTTETPGAMATRQAEAMPGVMTLRAFRTYQRMAEGGALYRELSAGFEAPRHPVTKREAVARFTDVVHAFASAVLAAPADYTAHAVNYATGLLNEAVDYVKAEQAATQRGSNV